MTSPSQGCTPELEDAAGGRTGRQPKVPPHCHPLNTTRRKALPVRTWWDTDWLGGGSHRCVTPALCAQPAGREGKRAPPASAPLCSRSGSVSQCTARRCLVWTGRRKQWHGPQRSAGGHLHVGDLALKRLVPVAFLAAVPPKACVHKQSRSAPLPDACHTWVQQRYIQTRGPTSAAVGTAQSWAGVSLLWPWSGTPSRPLCHARGTATPSAPALGRVPDRAMRLQLELCQCLTVGGLHVVRQ